MNISTGIASLDQILNNSGVPTGRVTEFYGQGSLIPALGTIAQAQKLGLLCALIDCDQKLGISEIEKAFVSTRDLMVSQPPDLAETMAIASSLVSLGARLVVINGYTTMQSREEMHYGPDALPMQIEAQQARETSAGLRQLTALAHKHGAAVVFTRDATTRSGGTSALKFYGAIRVETKMVGPNLWARVVKNKLGGIGAMAQIVPVGDALTPMAL